MRPHGPRRYKPKGEVVAEEKVVSSAPASTTETVDLLPADATTIPAILEWVKAGDVTARAQLALDAENSKKESDRRKSLVKQLTDLIQTDLV